MRCPTCGSETAETAACARCGGRLFRWLGDPFGNLEVGPAGPAAAATDRSRFALNALVGLLAVAALAAESPPAAVAGLVILGGVLARWPRLGLLPWIAFVLTTSLLLGSVASALFERSPNPLIRAAAPFARPAAASTRPAPDVVATRLSGLVSTRAVVAPKPVHPSPDA